MGTQEGGPITILLGKTQQIGEDTVSVLKVKITLSDTKKRGLSKQSEQFCKGIQCTRTLQVL